MLNINNKFPRFQFFFKKKDLIKSLVSLTFSRLKRGKLNLEFENLMKDYFSRKYCSTTSSFRVGFFYALKALNLQKGDEVLLSPITIPETLNAIHIHGLRPVYVDLDLKTHAICPVDLKAKISNKTKLVLITYLSGIPANMDPIMEIVKAHNIKLIEDFSQNFGASDQFKKFGSFGDISIGSLSCGKVFSATVGGFVLTDNDQYFSKIKEIQNLETKPLPKMILLYYIYYAIKVSFATSRLLYILITHPYLKLQSILSSNGVVDFEHDPENKLNVFYTYKPKRRNEFPKIFFSYFTDWQARIAIDTFLNFKKNLRVRRNLAKELISSLNEESLKRVPNNLLKIEENSYYHFPIYCFGQKDHLRNHMFGFGIDSGGYGLNLMTEEEAFKDYSCEMKNSQIIKHDTMYLPINEAYSVKQMRYIGDALNKFQTK